MKVTSIIASGALLLPILAGCQKTSTADDSPPPAPATPAPSAPTIPAAPIAEFAPPGVFYLIAPARIETADGIVGLNPGTGLKLVRPGVYLSPSGEVSLRDDQVTNNVTLARQVLAADQSSQAALRNSLAAMARQANLQRQAAAAQSAATNAAASQSMNGDARRTRIAVLTAQRDALAQQLSGLQSERSGENYRQTYQRHIIASSTNDQIAAVQQQLLEVQSELAALNASP